MRLAYRFGLCVRSTFIALSLIFLFFYLSSHHIPLVTDACQHNQACGAVLILASRLFV